VSKLAGRGTYTNEELETWLADALDAGISQIDIWYFIGMPEQDAESVKGTVDYCARLLHKFKSTRVNPMICPMIPFLDPASTFFERPDEHGYRVFFRSVEEHRVGMTRASLVNRINYETRWLDRRALVDVGYAAVRRLTEAKAEFGQLPSGIAHSVIARMDDAIDFIKVVHAVDEIQEAPVRMRELRSLGSEIRRRNEQVFFGGVANLAFPIDRAVGGRWFDELGWDPAILDDLDPMGASTAQEGSVIGARRAVPFHPAVVSSPTP
jgi:clorobiocin biosynthesis protein CloN6